MPRLTAKTAKPLSLAERKARLAGLAATASGKVKAGMALIDLREPTAGEKALAKKLLPLARRALARRSKKAA